MAKLTSIDWRDQPRLVSDQGLAYLFKAGEEPPVLLLHGVGLRAESWAKQLLAFDGHVQLIALDLPGHGESARLAPRTPRLEDYRDALVRFIEEVIGQPVILAGHSLGGLLALELACARSDLTLGLAALNTVFQRSPEAAAAVQARAVELDEKPDGDIASAPIRRWFGDTPGEVVLGAAEACRSWLTACDRQGYAQAYGVFAKNDGPSEAAIAGLDFPALFLTGAEDPNSTPEMSRRLAELAPQGRCVVVEGAAHMAQMTHPEAVNAALGVLINDCRGASFMQRVSHRL